VGIFILALVLLNACSTPGIQTAGLQNTIVELPTNPPQPTELISPVPTESPVPTNTPDPTATAVVEVSPTPFPPVMEMLALGDYHTCHLHSDGTVSCWGWNAYGQVGNPQTGDSDETFLFDLIGIHQISAGAYHTCALDWLGRVFCWGRNNVGQLGNNQAEDSFQPVQVEWIAQQNIIQLSAGSMHTCGVAETGKVYCWGSNHSGKLGAGSTEEYSRLPLPVSGLPESIVQVSAGGNHTCAVGVSGSVWCWGDGKDGQLSQGVFDNSSKPVKIKGLTKAVIGIGSGWYHTCALVIDGSVSCWGENEKGQLGNASTLKQARVVNAVGLYDNVSQISAGGQQTCAVKSGVLFCWGDDNTGLIGSSATITHLTPYIIRLRGEFDNLYLGGSHACVLNSTGEVTCWGADDHHQLGDYEYYFVDEPPSLE